MIEAMKAPVVHTNGTSEIVDQNPPIEITAEMVEAYEERRRMECANKIQAVLDEYGYGLTATVPEVQLVKMK